MKIPSELIGVILGAVITGIFPIIQAFKGNKLQYITIERSKWREKLRSLIVEIYNSDKDSIKEKLVELGSYINQYGKHRSGNYPKDVDLDFEKDEHIWKEIDKIENILKEENTDKIKDNENDFDRCKNNLINYLELLLKFDWERHKKEVKTNILTCMAVIIFISINFLFYFANKHILPALILPIVTFVVQILLFQISKHLPKYKKWYKRETAILVNYLMSIIYFLEYFINIDLFSKDFINFYILNEYIVNNELLYMVARICLILILLIVSAIPPFLLSLFINVDSKHYVEYDRKIREILVDDTVCIYFKRGNLISEMYLDTFRRKKLYDIINLYNITTEENYSYDDINVEEIQKQVKSIKVKNGKINTRKTIILYKKDGKEYYCVSNKKSDWKNFIEEKIKK